MTQANKIFAILILFSTAVRELYHHYATMPPIVNGKRISNFQKKANLFNNHFASQCAPVKNTSRLPNLKYKTDKSQALIWNEGETVNN